MRAVPRCCFPCIVAILIGGFAAAPSRATAAENIAEEESGKRLRAGAYAIDVTPQTLPVLVNGGMYSRSSDKIVDRLHARCLVLDDGTGKIAIVVVDSCMLPRALLDDAKQLASKATGIPTERMLISATHTHSAPAAMGCLGTDVDKQYAAFLPARIARGIQLAHDNLEPARIGWASDRDPENVYCRRFLMKEGTARTNPFSGKTNDRAQMNPGHDNPNAIRRTGPVDDEVFVLSVQSNDGRPIALLANYSTHYAGAPPLSADYFGVFADKIRQRLEADDATPDFVGIMSNGTSGDANCLDFTRGSRRKYDRLTVAEDTAAAALRAYKKIEYYDWAPIVMAQGLLELDVRMPTGEEVARAKEFLKTDEGKRLRSIPAVYARETVLLSQMPPTRELKLQAIRIGPLGITAIPNEVYGITGLRLKKDSPLPSTFNIELANGAEGYIPPPEQHKLGGYTTWRARTSCLEEQAEPKIRAKLIELLNDVARRRNERNQGADAPRSPITSPVSPEQSLNYLHVRPGMKVELVAAEPLVRDPVAFDWGPDGKLWVVEYLDYPTGIDGKGTGGGRVVFLEDENDDGRYDKSTVFIDTLNFPTGVMAWRGGILITAAPDILYAEDTDDDGKADKVEKLYTGFHEANQQLRVNGLRWGLDNWIYCASGSHHGNYGKESKIKSTKTGELVHIGARDFRIRPDKGLIEPVSGPSQFGRNRDAWGNWFGCQNAKPMWHYVLEDRYLRRNPHVNYPDGKVLISDVPGQRPVFPRSQPGKFHHASQAGRFTSANSAMIYRDELLGEDFIGNSFVSEPVHNLVHREIVERDGVTFKSYKPKDEEQTEFLASEDTWFRPTTIRTGPDGALWIADMYREIIEHPRWVSDELKPVVDVRTGTDRGRIYRIYPENMKPRKIPRLDKRSAEELVAHLESPSATLRDMAHIQIVTRKLNDAIEPLEKLARESEQPQTRLQAMCVLDGLKRLPAELALAAASDPNRWVRREAIRFLESPDHQSSLLEVDMGQTERDAAVRLQYAFSLGEYRAGTLGGASLAEIARADGNNPYIRAAVLSSLQQRNIRTFAEMWFTHLAEDKSLADEVLIGLIDTSLGGKYTLLVEMIVGQAAAPDVDGAFAAWQLSALAILYSRLAKRDPPLSEHLDFSSDEQQGVKAAFNSAADFARNALRNPDSDAALQKAAIQLLGAFEKSQADWKLLAEQLQPHVNRHLQIAAVSALSRAEEPRAAQVLLQDWKSHSPQLRSQVLAALLSRTSWTDALLTAIEERLVPAADVSTASRDRLLKSRNARIRERAEEIFSDSLDSDREKIVAQYRPILKQPSARTDLEQGKAVFKQRCSACHKLDGVGNEVGPDLKGLTDKSPDNLLTSILDPNRAVEPKYLSYTAVTGEGRIYNGMLADEAGGSLTLLDAEGKKHVIRRGDLEELHAGGKSLMPEGLEKDISPEQMRDLLAYLQQALRSD